MIDNLEDLSLFYIFAKRYSDDSRRTCWLVLQAIFMHGSLISDLFTEIDPMNLTSSLLRSILNFGWEKH